MWSGGMQYLLFAAVILCAVGAKLTSIASEIAIEKDWIVVFTWGDEAKLASMLTAIKHYKYLQPLRYNHFNFHSN
jgi:hypothetical protein